MSRIKHIKQYPAAFQSEAMKINEIIDQLNPILAAVGGGSVNITKAGDNWIISSTGGTGGAPAEQIAAIEAAISAIETRLTVIEDLLDGLSRVTDTYCNSGTPDTRVILADET